MPSLRRPVLGVKALGERTGGRNPTEITRTNAVARHWADKCAHREWHAMDSTVDRFLARPGQAWFMRHRGRAAILVRMERGEPVTRGFKVEGGPPSGSLEGDDRIYRGVIIWVSEGGGYKEAHPRTLRFGSSVSARRPASPTT